MPNPTRILLVLLALCSLGPRWAEARAGDELDLAIAHFRQACAGWDSERQASLEALVALLQPQSVPVLVAEFSRSSEARRKAADQELVLRHRLDHRRRIVADLELRAQRDESLKAILPKEREGIEGVEKELAKQQQILAREVPWQQAMVASTHKLFEGMPELARSSALKLLWEAAEKPPALQDRLGAIELLGQVGEDGTALALQRMQGELLAKRADLQKRLPKAEIDVHKLEKRMQSETETLGGSRLSQATQQEYERVRAEAAGMRRDLTVLGHMIEAVGSAAAAGLAREQPEVQKRSVQALQRALAKASGEARLTILKLLALSDSEPVRAALRAELDKEKEPAAQAQILTDLATLGETSLVEPLLQRWIDQEPWIVQAAAVKALVLLRDKRAIAPLIDRLGRFEGRLVTDVRRALVSLTGQDYRTNQELWRRWWADHEQDFEVPPPAAPSEASEEAKDAVGVTFFGISTESRRVLFVLDVSGSMNFSVVARDNPSDDPGRPYDMPQEGEISRLEAAKRDLLQAIGGLIDGGVCNLVSYASDVWSWSDQPVTLDADKRGKLQTYIANLTAVGGTNIYGALELAFDLAGIEGKGKWEKPAFDTIFFLSDGRASVGVTNDPEEILAFVRERNAAAGIVIHTVGVSGAQDAYLMRNLAEENGGIYVSH